MREFQAKLFEQGKAAGFTDMEIYYQTNRETTVRVFKGEIDSYSIAEKGGLAFRGEIGGQMGNSFTEKLDEEAITLLLTQAKENAEIIESQDRDDLFAGSERYAELNLYSETLKHTSADELIEAAKQLEQTAAESDPRIDLVNMCAVTNYESELTLINTKGLNCQTKRNMAYGYVSAVAKEAGGIASAMNYAMAQQQLSELNVTETAQAAAKEALSRLGGQPVESGEYPVIFDREAASSLLQSFSSIFSGEAAQKGLSLLQGKVGEQVMGVNITIVDDPHLPAGPGSVPFDSEGVATSRHDVVRNGQLLTFLHNRKSAQAVGVGSTGNAVKSSYRAATTVQPNNLYIEPGTQSLDELIAGTEKGLLIVDLQGLHAGTNSISGDFSLSCLGYLIEAGQVVRPVNQITVSGNILGMLNQVEAVASELKFKGTGRGACASPALKIRSLSIGGK